MYVDHNIFHPNGSVAHANWGQDQTLHVAVAFNNPYRWHTRLWLFNDFRRHMQNLPNVKLYVGEIAYGDRPFEVTSVNNPNDYQYRSMDVLWHKENLLNRVIQNFDKDWKYGCYVDGDMSFNRYDIGLETIHQLQLHEWVQMFSTMTDLCPQHEPLRTFKGFARSFLENGCVPMLPPEMQRHDLYYGLAYGEGRKKSIGATGGAWAFRRSSFEACGGLLDTCILGSGDWHMSYGLVQEPLKTAETTLCSPRYMESLRVWQKRAAACRRNVGVVPCHVTHYWHGSRERRGYGTRWKILRDNNFDPYSDICRNADGIYQLHPDRIKLRDDIRRYFSSRIEDDIQLMGSDKHIASWK